MPAVLKSDLSVEVESPEIARRCVCRTHKMTMCLSNSQDDDSMSICRSNSQDDDSMSMCLSNTQDDDSMPMCLSNSQDDDVFVELTR